MLQHSNLIHIYELSSSSVGKEYACNAGDLGSIPESGRFLEEEMTTHSSILAWEILWTEEPGRLQSMGSQRIRHDLATKQQQLETDDFTSFVLILKSFIVI